MVISILTALKLPSLIPSPHLDPTPPRNTQHVHHVLPPGCTHRIPLPYHLRAATSGRHPCSPFQCILPQSRQQWRRRRGEPMACRYHHRGCVRRPRTGHALQVPHALLRARLRLFRDRQLGRLAILSQFVNALFLGERNHRSLSHSPPLDKQRPSYLSKGETDMVMG